MRSIVILAALSVLALPAGARAHEEEGAWDAPPPPPADDSGVDVSVGISAPGAAVNDASIAASVDGESGCRPPGGCD